MVFDFLKVLENTPIAQSGRELQRRFVRNILLMILALQRGLSCTLRF